jgi:hypothetical protein
MQPCTYGKTYEDAIANAQEAMIAGYLDYCQEKDFRHHRLSCSGLNMSDRLSKMRTRSLTE